MKRLLLDAGNTRLKWAVCEEGQLSQQGSLTYEWPSLENQLNTVFSKLLVEAGPLDGVVLSNVVGKKLTAVLQKVFDGMHLGGEPPKQSLPLAIENVTAQPNAYDVCCAYENPAQLGADRWAALVAARHYGIGDTTGASCIIDSGTALTVDVLTADGRHAGGIIIPGMEMMVSSLVDNTEGVFASDQAELSPLAVTNTAAAVQAGVGAAMRGAVQQVLQYCREEFGETPACVLTGGNAQRLLPDLPDSTRLEPDWVLKGLAIIAAADQ